MRVLVAGCGWLGTALARALIARGDRVIGVKRTPTGAEALRWAGVEPLVLDLADPDASRALPTDVDAIVGCQAAAEGSTEGYRRAYVDANLSLLALARQIRPRAFVYTGSTGVFGQTDGRDVDETTPPAPSGPNGAILLDAESRVLEAAREGLETRLVRLTGLYGPDRTGVVQRVKEGRLALGRGDDTWMNWCHRDDAVAAILAALERGSRGSVYHATDAEPVRRRDVVRWVAERLGIPAPRAEGGRGANRRILGTRTRAELGLSLAFPSFRDGLAPLIPRGQRKGSSLDMS